MFIIEAEGLTKKFNGFTAVDRISFRVEQGEIFAFLGPNGAGKTTTINMLTGLARISAGTIRLGGWDYGVRGSLKKGQQRMGIVPDESNLYEELDGFNNLCFCASLYGIGKPEREKRARELLKQFNLKAAGKRPFRAYSKGMKRKLTLAAGIIHQPEVLFLDEPTTGIDVESARQIRALIQQLNKAGTTIFLTTHYIEEAERLCQRLAFIVEGRIVRQGGLAELMEEGQGDYIVQFILDEGGAKHAVEQALPAALAARFPHTEINIHGDREVRVTSSVPLELAPLIEIFSNHHLPVFEARIMRPTLEDVFVRITGIEAARLKKEKEGKKG